MLSKPKFERLKVLASAKARRFEIEARTIIPLAIFATIHHLISASGLVVAHAKLARSMLGVDRIDGKILLLGSLTSQSHLPSFQRHPFWLHRLRNMLPAALFCIFFTTIFSRIHLTFSAKLSHCKNQKLFNNSTTSETRDIPNNPNNSLSLRYFTYHKNPKSRRHNL